MDVVYLAQKHPVAAVAVVGILFWCMFTAVVAKPTYPESLPWVGRKRGTLFAGTRAAFASFFNVRIWLAEGYEKYSQQGKSYMFPNFSGQHELMLPNDQLKWLTDHGDDIVSSREAHYDQLHGEYAFTDPRVIGNGFHERVIHKSLFRKLDAIIPAIHDELVASIDTLFGLDGEWKQIPVWHSMMDMIARVSNRVFVGLPLCRNADFLANNSAFAEDVILAMTILSFFPTWSHPVVGRLVCLRNNYHYWRTRRHTLPLIKQRTADFREKDSDPDSKLDIPEDYITWHIRKAIDDGDHAALDPAFISRSIMPVEFAAIHTTTLTATMCLFDLFSTDPKSGFVDGVQEECTRVFKESNGVWDKKGLAKLVRTDSAIRESMRVSNFGTRSAQKKVVTKDGLHNPEEGWTAPYGTYFAINQQSRHHDPSIYPDPDTYDAFRFSRQREEYEAMPPGALNPEEYLKMKNLSMVSTGENFLPFGHGRHACPGRFMVQHELKMMLAHILMNYEVQTLSERPPNQWMGSTVIPPMRAGLNVRRRQQSAK